LVKVNVRVIAASLRLVVTCRSKMQKNKRATKVAAINARLMIFMILRDMDNNYIPASPMN
jgi:hypothetical protein